MTEPVVKRVYDRACGLTYHKNSAIYLSSRSRSTLKPIIPDIGWNSSLLFSSKSFSPVWLILMELEMKFQAIAWENISYILHDSWDKDSLFYCYTLQNETRNFVEIRFTSL